MSSVLAILVFSLYTLTNASSSEMGSGMPEGTTVSVTGHLVDQASWLAPGRVNAFGVDTGTDPGMATTLPLLMLNSIRAGYYVVRRGTSGLYEPTHFIGNSSTVVAYLRQISESVEWLPEFTFAGNVIDMVNYNDSANSGLVTMVPEISITTIECAYAGFYYDDAFFFPGNRSARPQFCPTGSFFAGNKMVATGYLVDRATWHRPGRVNPWGVDVGASPEMAGAINLLMPDAIPSGYYLVNRRGSGSYEPTYFLTDVDAVVAFLRLFPETRDQLPMFSVASDIIGMVSFDDSGNGGHPVHVPKLDIHSVECATSMHCTTLSTHRTSASGYLMDYACWSIPGRVNPYGVDVRNHPEMEGTRCLLMDICINSGYFIMSRTGADGNYQQTHHVSDVSTIVPHLMMYPDDDGQLPEFTVHGGIRGMTMYNDTYNGDMVLVPRLFIDSFACDGSSEHCLATAPNTNIVGVVVGSSVGGCAFLLLLAFFIRRLLCSRQQNQGDKDRQAI